MKLASDHKPTVPGGFLSDAIKGKSRIQREQEELQRLRMNKRIDEERPSTTSSRGHEQWGFPASEEMPADCDTASKPTNIGLLQSIEKPAFDAASLHKEHFANLTPHTWEAVNDIVARYSSRAISAKSSNCKSDKQGVVLLSGKIRKIEDQGDLCDCCSHPRRSLKDCKERVSRRASLRNEQRNSFMEQVEEKEEEVELFERSPLRNTGNPISQFDIETTKNGSPQSEPKSNRIEEEFSDKTP